MRSVLLAASLLLSPIPAQERSDPARGRRRLPQVMALPTYPVVRRGTRIQVDGSLHEWPSNLPGIVLQDPRQLSGTANKSFRGPTDLSANGGAVWDDDRLYFWFVVQDDWGRPLDTTKQRPTRLLLPPGDSVVLYFDPRRDTRSYGPDPGRAEDREWWLGMTRKGQTLRVRCQRRFATASLDSMAEARILYDRRARRYTVEASIPWTELLVQKPAVGTAIDFQVILNDFDEPTDPLPQTRIGWTFGTGPKINPAVYGTLVLSGPHWGKPEPPARPALPERDVADLPDKKYWISLQRELDGLTAKPGTAGLGGKRGKLLASLDTHLAKYPLNDHQELLMLMQREMVRELAGYLDEGAPYFFDLVMQEILRDLGRRHRGDPTVVALPGRGFLVRSEQGNVAVSPACIHAQKLGPRLAAVLFSNCWDPLDRHDPLMLRALSEGKPVLCHLAFHLPGYGPLRRKNVAVPGFELTAGKGIRIRVLGKRDKEGRVTPTVGYQLTWPSGFTIVHPSLSAQPDQVDREDRAAIDILILDPDHPHADRLVEELAPKLVVLEGFCDLPRWAPGDLPRNHRWQEAKTAVERFETSGARVVVLGPGQSSR